MITLLGRRKLFLLGFLAIRCGLRSVPLKGAAHNHYQEPTTDAAKKIFSTLRFGSDSHTCPFRNL